MHIAVIGAGIAGLAVARHAVEAANRGVRVTVFEQSPAIGGIWSYSETVGPDEYGVQNSTSMYADLV